jgi:phthalate 4,5-dioxygenase oxygenase subunit
MLTKDENDLLTLVEGDAPMGRMLRENFWMPAMLAAPLEADGAPIRVRLLGEDFVAFRATDGRVGFLDEACPHRGTSLALARNEDCALRCIFHGWKIDVSGQVVEIPTEAGEAAVERAAQVKVNHYPAREAGGLIWVWLGKSAPGPFPDLGFCHVPLSQVSAAVTKVPYNWVGSIEATVDSAHIGFLHRDWLKNLPTLGGASMENTAPTYEFEDRPYGYRAAALRRLGDGTTHVRINEFVMPFHSSPGGSGDTQSSYQISVPVDNETTNFFFVRWNTAGPVNTGNLAPAGADLNNWVPLPGTRENNWGQDREAMKRGSFSGFDTFGILTEDTVVQASIGPIADRAREQLSASDMCVVRTRRLLIKAARDFMAGERPLGATGEVPYPHIRGATGVLTPGQKWQDELRMEAA